MRKKELVNKIEGLNNSVKKLNKSVYSIEKTDKSIFWCYHGIDNIKELFKSKEIIQEIIKKQEKLINLLLKYFNLEYVKTEHSKNTVEKLRKIKKKK